MSTVSGASQVIPEVVAPPVVPQKKPTLVYVFAILFIIGAFVVFVGTFIYFVSETNQYKKACTGVTIKRSITGIITMVIGAIVVLAAIAVLIFAIFKKANPELAAATTAAGAAQSVVA
jgi:nitrate reductase gamma subunit